MAKFVWLERRDGVKIAVNPDQVAYVGERGGRAVLVFGAVNGGMHEMTLPQSQADAVRLLERVDLAMDEVFAALKPAPAAADAGYQAAVDVARLKGRQGKA